MNFPTAIPLRNASMPNGIRYMGQRINPAGDPPATTTPAPSSSTTSSTPMSTSTSNTNNPSIAWANTAGTALGVAGTTISTILTQGTTERVAELQSQTQQKIAELQAQTQQALAAGNAAAAQATQQQTLALQTLQAQLQSRQQEIGGTNTMLYVGLGVAALAVVGVIGYAALSRPRANPSHHYRHRRIRRHAR